MNTSKKGIAGEVHLRCRVNEWSGLEPRAVRRAMLIYYPSGADAHPRYIGSRGVASSRYSTDQITRKVHPEIFDELEQSPCLGSRYTAISFQVFSIHAPWVGVSTA